MLRIINGHLLTCKGIDRGELWCNGGKIVPPGAKPSKTIDAQGMIIAPGYIDLHINGAYGVDFTTHPEKVGEAARKLPLHGVTSFLPTVVSAPKKEYGRLINMLQPRPVSGGASLLGIHLEGPFLNPHFCGAHEKKHLAKADDQGDLRSIYGSLSGVKMITLAPELPHMREAIARLLAKKIVVAIGHSAASLQEVKEAGSWGASVITHLYNAMPLFHHRKPGVIDAALIDPKMKYTLICDGVHVDEQAIRLAWSQNREGMIIISDAMAGLGLPSGDLVLGGLPVTIKKERAYLAGTETLAGSIQGIDANVRLLRQMTGCSIQEAVDAATGKPAELLGLKGIKGCLSPGADADFIFLDEALYVHAAFVLGNRVV